MLVTASIAIAYAATSTSAGSSTWSMSERTVMVSRSGRSPSRRQASCSAPTRPSSSSAGGRSEYTSVRRSPMALRVCPSSSPSTATARAGSAVTRSWVAPSRWHRLASVGPRPSCRSRCRRRRSSSRMLTARWRERRRSAVRPAARTAGPDWVATSPSRSRSRCDSRSRGRGATPSRPTCRPWNVTGNQRSSRTGRCAVLGRARPVGELEEDVGEPQRGADRVDDGLPDLVARHGRRQPLPELGHDRTGVVARAVHPAVDALLHPEPDGSEDHRGQPRRDHRQDACLRPARPARSHRPPRRTRRRRRGSACRTPGRG